MLIGKVIGSVWATRKHPGLEGQRLLLVQGLDEAGQSLGHPFAALDTMDAGAGDVVIYATSAEAAIPFHPRIVPTDATVVGIVERVDSHDA